MIALYKKILRKDIKILVIFCETQKGFYKSFKGRILNISFWNSSQPEFT